jgi:hypothetical protein
MGTESEREGTKQQDEVKRATTMSAQDHKAGLSVNDVIDRTL